MTRREDNISPRIVKAELAGVKTTSFVVDDSGRGGCMATGMSAAGRLTSGPEKIIGSSTREHVPKTPAVICVAAGENHPSPKAAVRLSVFHPTAAESSVHPPFLTAAAGARVITSSLSPHALRFAATNIESPFCVCVCRAVTAAQQGVSRGQDRAAARNDWSAAAGKFQPSPGWCFMDLPTRAGVRPALGNNTTGVA